MALRQKNLVKNVVGIGRRQASLRIARRVGAVTHTTIDLAKGVADAELIVVCTPVEQIVGHVREVAKHCPGHALITDAGSTKQMSVDALAGHLDRGCRFLGSHPLAGGEKGGPAHANADLFEGRVAILTPTRNTRAEDFDLLESFWSSLGSLVMQMPPEEHDRVLALTSHLPHAVAAVLATMVPETCFRLSGAGLLDTTRIAASDPDLWLQIFQSNRENLLRVLRQYHGELGNLIAALAASEAPRVHEILTRAKKNRNALGN